MGLGTEGGVAVAPRLSPVEYEELISGVRAVVHRVVPLNTTVLVVSRGDEELMQLGPRTALHFPQDEDGRYAGYHPSDSDTAIAMVEDLRERKGAEYLLLPATGFWWLEYYEDFKRYLEHRYQVIEEGEHCWIVQLTERTEVAGETTFTGEAPPRPDIASPMYEVIEALLPSDAQVAFLAVSAEDVAEHYGYRVWRVPKPPQADSRAVSDSLKALQQSGIQFIVIPQSAFDWLDEHPEAAEWLRRDHRFVIRQERLCEIYELHPPAVERKLHGREESNARKRSFGEMLRGILFPSRRNGSNP